jgi:hypothetical protein
MDRAAPDGEMALFAVEVKRALVGRQVGAILEQFSRTRTA